MWTDISDVAAGVGSGVPPALDYRTFRLAGLIETQGMIGEVAPAREQLDESSGHEESTANLLDTYA